MSTFASKFNKHRLFEVNTEGFEYQSLADLYNANGKEAIYPLKAIYINTKGKFGDAPVFATDWCFVNAPSHMLETANAILRDEGAVKAINNGEVGFVIYAYVARDFQKECFGINFVDIEK